MSFDNNSFYDDNSTKKWQPQPTPMEDEARRNEDEHARQTLLDIVATPISPELLPPSEDGEKILAAKTLRKMSSSIPGKNETTITLEFMA